MKIFIKGVDRVDIKIYLCAIFYSNKCNFLLHYIRTGSHYVLTGLKLPLIYMTVIYGHLSSMKLCLWALERFRWRLG